ncbi:MAG: hypothetical protein ACLS9F_00035 [Clostridium paraputrificum]
MKKKVSILLSGLLLLGLVGCGGSEPYEPSLSNTGVVYASKSNQNADGTNASINVKSVTRDGDSIIIETDNPTDQISYANKNFLAFVLIDEEGKEYTSISGKVTDNNGSAKITIAGEDAAKGKYIQIMPYKTKEGNYIEFEIK